MTETAIRTWDLSKSYGETRAVNHLTLTVPRGSIYGFLGRNGAGKTCTIKMLLGLARPSSGSAHIFGMDTVLDRSAILRRTAFVSEKKALYQSLTASEMVRFSRGFYPTWRQDAVERYANLFEIPMNKRFETLSNGNQTKLWLLLALCQGADLLVLDEPTTALDPITVDQLMRVLAEETLDRGTTVFFSSHQLEEVERIVEYVGFMEGGRLLLESRLDDIKSEFRMITATGAPLPEKLLPVVLSVEIDSDCRRYVVTRDAENFAAALSQNGAAVVSVVPLSLREIFLRVVRKEQPCTSGSAGATPDRSC
ncbi:MAG: ABC transporter ATP-binding protein [Candidatus Acidiferrales bacterium]